MRVFFALVACVALAAAHHGGAHVVPDLFEGQREYVYDYRSLVASGLPIQSQRYAGLEKFGVLTVQVQEQQGSSKTLGLRLGHVMSGHFDQEVRDIENHRIEGVSHSVVDSIEKYGPVFVKIQDNEVQKLKAPEQMPEEIINIYRGIAAVFTLGKPESVEGEQHPFMNQEDARAGMNGSPIVYRRQEQGITGNFETTYEILSNPEQYNNQLNITKTRNQLKNIGHDGRYFQTGHDARGCQNVCPTHKPEQFEKSMEPETSGWSKQSAEGCPVNFHPKTDLVEAFQTYNYNVTLKQGGKVALIEQAQALDKKTLPIRKQQIKTVSLVKLNLVEERPISQVWQQAGAFNQYEDITYRFPQGSKVGQEYLSLYNKAQNGEMLKDQIIPMIKALTEVIVSDNIELKGQTGDKIVQITMALAALDKPELQALWTVLGESATGKSVTEFAQVQRKVLIDTIALSGSNNASEWLLDLIQGQKLSTLETVHTLESLQKNIAQPSLKVMQQLLGLITDSKIQGDRLVLSAASLAFAEIVRGNSRFGNQQWASQQGHVLTEQEYKQYVNTIRQQLHSSHDFAQQTIFIQTLGRLAHPDAIKALIPYVYGEQEVYAQAEQSKYQGQKESTKEYVDFLRQVAIYALHHSAQLHGAAVQPIVQGIYFDKQQGYELRIAALSVIIAGQPSEATFGRIALEIPQEQNLEVASFAYSALHSLANSSLPCMEQSARRVRNVLGSLPEQAFGAIYSKWGTKTYWSPESNLGLKAQWDLVQSNVSFVPRAFWGGLSANKGPFVSTTGDFGFVTKGLENVQQYISQHGGMTKIVENVMQRFRRDARTLGGNEAVQQIVQQLEESMQFNYQGTDEQPRAIVFGSLLGNEAFLPIDKEYVTKVAQKAGEYVIDLVRGQGIEQSFRFVRVLMPRTYLQVAPAVNGLPVVLSNQHPIVVSLSLKDIKTRWGTGKGMTLTPATIGLSGLVQPTVYHTSIHSVYTINPVEGTRVAHGVRATEETTVTLPVDFSVQYTQKTGTFGFTIRPRFEKVFFHKTQAVAFKTEANLIRGTEQPILDQYTTIKTQQKPFVYDTTFGEKLGMALRVQGMSMNEEYAVNFFNNRDALDKNVMHALIKEISNEWFAPRTWAVRFEQNQQWAVQELKMVVRLDNLLQSRMRQANGEAKYQQHLTHQELADEQQYPEHMRMIAYEQEFEKITGRKPQQHQLEEALERIVKKTEKYWSQIERDSGKMNLKENSQARSVEYVISAKGEKKNMAITGQVVLASTSDKQMKFAEIKMNVEKQPISFECHAVSAFTKAPQPFETEVREQEQRGIFGFNAELETRQTGKQQYSGKIEMTKSEEQKEHMRALNTGSNKQWFHRQCEEDKKQQRSEISPACSMIRSQKSALNHLRFEVELPEQVHERLGNVSHQIREALKLRLYRNLQSEKHIEGQEKKIQGELIISQHKYGMKVADLTIRTPDHEELRFERIAYPLALQPNTQYSVKQLAKIVLKKNAPEPTCLYNGHNLRTFDGVYVSMEQMKEGEKHVIARDNNKQSMFTILGEKKQGGQQTHLEIVLRDSTLVKLTPATQKSGATYKVAINSTEIEVSPMKTEVFQYGRQNKNMITMHVEQHLEGQDTLVVKVRDQRIHIVYDGKNVKIQIAKAGLKGQLTGLCGDMNRQRVEEFTGPEGCKYQKEGDFVRSFGLQGQRQQGMEGKWSCPMGVYPRAASKEEITTYQQRQTYAHQQQQKSQQQRQAQRQQQGQTTEETKMISHNGMICFSLEPVQACEQGSRQTESEMKTVAFTCLNQENQRAMQLQREIQTQKVVSSLPSHAGRTSSLIHREVEVAVQCSQ